MKFSYLAPCLAVVFASCSVGPDFQLPAFLGGNGWKQSQVTGEASVPDDWWVLYKDSELTRLVESAIKDNQDLQAGRARVKTSRSLVGVDRARMFPMLDLMGTGASVRYSEDALSSQLPPGVSIPLSRENYRSTFDLSYDLDLWGKNRRLLESSKAKADASVALFDAQRLGLAAEVARQYFLLRGLDRQLAVIDETITGRRKSHDFQQSREEAGLADQLLVRQAKTELELAKNDRSVVRRQRGAAEHALAVLCGLPPSKFSVKPMTKSPSRLPVIQPGLPAEVLSRRPDVRAAEQHLRSANAEIGVAESAFYPSFSLSASGGYESLDISRFLEWENRVLSLGGGIVAPIFHGGSNKAAWEAAVSRRDEALADYKSTLLVALREVEDALIDMKGLAVSHTVLDQAHKSARAARGIAQERYDKGLVDYLDVIDTDRAALSVELMLVQCEANQRITLAVLAKALGGGWKRP